VAKSGTYTGSANKTYVVKIVESGALGTAKYQVSSLGGKKDSWSTEATVPGDGKFTIGDGIDLDFDAGSADLTTDDIFYVHAFAAGYYNGNGEEMSVNIGEGTSFAYSISGEAAFTDKGEGSVEIFNALNLLKEKLENNDPDGIASCIDDLKAASDQISKNISRCGARMNRLEIAKNNMADMEMDLAGLISEVEDADVSEIITKFAMKEIVLKASYAVASRIGNLTIIDFLR
jgi:flagellar hook-associated protein 3 FlgL